VVGRLNNKAQTLSVRVSATQQVNKVAKVFIMRQEGQHSEWRDLVPRSTAVGDLGRHYLLRSFGQSNVKRHYSIASCMRDDAYKAYLNLIKQWKENPEGTLQFDKSVLPESDQEG